MKRVLIGALIFIVYLACVIATAFVLHFSGGKFAFFCILLGFLGGVAIAFAVWHMSRVGGESAVSGGTESIHLDALLRDADRKLRTSRRVGVKSLAMAPIIYILGEENSAKTQTVLQSGLDAELLAGNLLRDGIVAPTQLANIWLAGSFVIVEAGGALLRQPTLWHRLIKATRPGQFRSLFAKGSRQAPRAVVACVSAERVLSPSEAGYDANHIRSSAQALNERLRQLSQLLGISVPVYVLFTKLDTLNTPAHFANYVGRLSSEEINAPLGSLLENFEAGTGLFAERASMLIGSRLDELIYDLSEFRIEVLSRGGELKMLAGAYEFPRDLQKRRGTIVDFLVELTRPSQLGINPFLRGFFFSGLRAIVVEEAVAAHAQPQPSAPIDAGATRVFSIAGGQINQPAQQSQRTVSRRVPQWAFLPHLFSKLLVNDRSALEASRASTKVNLLKRALLAGACCCIFIYLVLLTISFFNNRDLARQVAAAAATQVSPAIPSQLASIHDLQTLDAFRVLLLQLNSYRRNGAPLMYRWGLYSGDSLYPTACNAYSNKFRAVLLGPAQMNILTQFRTLHSPPPAGADYLATYKPLKAYLISTSNPEKSAEDPGFLAPILTAAWTGKVIATTDLTRLAQNQFETYGTILSESQSCIFSIGGQPDGTAVDHAREYLNGFGGFLHVYQSMLADASKRSQSVRFNDKFPGSSHYIVDSYEVPGAFTKPGFAFMQNAIQHPEPYFSGEEWVLGPKADSMPDRVTLIAQLQKQYVGDYLAMWRGYLNAAHFVNFQNWNDAAGKLSALDSNSSAILQLFSLISINTGVAQYDISNAFQAPQVVVPPTTPDNRFIAPSNQPYITALLGLEQAVRALSQNSLSTNDPAAAIPVQQAADTADQAIKNIRNSFNPDPDGKMDTVSFNRLEDPINSALALAKTAPAAAANGAGKTFCGQVGPVLAKFPFNPKSTIEASPEEAAQVFSPSQGYLAQFSATISKFLILQGNRYIANPASAITINPGFLNFFNTAQQVSSALFPPGANQPSLTFTLTQGKTVPDAVLTIDGQQLAAGQTNTFHWLSTANSKITLTTSAQNSGTIPPGPWSVFHLALDANHPVPNSFVPTFGYRETVRFDASGPGAALLNPGFMSQLHCIATVTKQ